ncbi:MAG: hypothetical protein PHI37_03595 [Candidatus Gracilibacteria bacterium]|nr:hypothetical protein [Candidatus Gracilibacteria bacterium]
MIKYIKLFLIFIIFTSVNTIKTLAADVDLIVSPIKYEIELNPGGSITKTAKLINKSNNPMIIYTGVSDFMSNDTSGNPVFVRKSELVNPNQELASWITINTNTINLNALEEKDVEFTINVPLDATPGGHYGAVFFKNYGENSINSGGQVKINVDYGVLLLINVDGEIIDNGKPGEPNINPGTSSGGGNIGYTLGGLKIDDCTLGDLTKSNIDGKCIDDFGLGNIIDDIIGSGSTDNNDNLKGNNDGNGIIDLDFNIGFEIPFSNEGNTHIKPTGKITLVDENGNNIKGVGKEIIKNDMGTIMGEKIVDYIPVNDNGGNVLPETTRIFKSEWRGFPYEDYDENGKKIIKYWTPSEYYTNKNIESKTFLFPWERINEKLENKKVTAIIELAYKNHEGENIEFNSAKDFYVDYKTEYIGYNPYFFIGLILTLGILWFILFILKRKRKKKCENCGKYIKKDMKICPYCGEKQKKK